MVLEDKNEQNQKVAGFRYSIIAELGNPNLSKRELKRMIREKAGRSYNIPYSTKTGISQKCIKKWLSNFKSRGIDGITPKIRHDIGKSRALTQAEQDSFISHLEKHPDLTAKAAFLDLQKKAIIKNDISSSSLSRLVIANGLCKKSRMNMQDRSLQEKTLKFNFKYPLECVQADFMHGFDVPDENGKMRKAKLISFIDDATRRIIYSCFTFSEKAHEFEKGIKWILTTHGKISRIYVDNGASFISVQTQRILAILGIPIIHSRPYRPQGRGKKERFYRTVREQFLRPLDKSGIQSIGQLDALFKSWLECEYHRNPHSGLNGQTPLDAWLAGVKYILNIDPSIDMQQIFLHQVKRKIYKDSTFSFNGKLFEVPSTLIGKTITVKHDSLKPNKPLMVNFDGQYICDARLLDAYANTKVSRNIYSKDHVNVDNQENPKIEKLQINRVDNSMAAAKIDM